MSSIFVYLFAGDLKPRDGKRKRKHTCTWTCKYLQKTSSMDTRLMTCVSLRRSSLGRSFKEEELFLNDLEVGSGVHARIWPYTIQLYILMILYVLYIFYQRCFYFSVSFLFKLFGVKICDVIKQKESELTIIDFEIEPIKRKNFLCFCFAKPSNCLYLWNQPIFMGFSEHVALKMYNTTT